MVHVDNSFKTGNALLQCSEINEAPNLRECEEQPDGAGNVEGVVDVVPDLVHAHGAAVGAVAGRGRARVDGVAAHGLVVGGEAAAAELLLGLVLDRLVGAVPALENK